jgi:hypothetical protein
MKECPFFNFLLENSKRKKKNCSFVYQEEFVCPDSGFLEITFQTFLCLFVIKKVGQRKTLSSQRKIWLDFQESVFILFWTENTF